MLRTSGPRNFKHGFTPGVELSVNAEFPQKLGARLFTATFGLSTLSKPSTNVRPLLNKCNSVFYGVDATLKATNLATVFV